MPVDRIDVVGLRDFQAALRKMDTDLPKRLRLALNKGAQLIVDKARPGIPRRSGRAAASLKVRSTQKEVRIGAGGTRAPYYPWLDFGGRVGKGRSVKRPFYQEGRFVYPALRKNRDELTDLLTDALRETANAAGLEVQ